MGADKGNARRLHPCHVANGSLTAGAGRAGGWVASAERAFLPLLAHRAKGAACRSPLKTWTLFSFQDNFSAAPYGAILCVFMLTLWVGIGL